LDTVDGNRYNDERRSRSLRRPSVVLALRNRRR
jgi:hypothetical protein